MNEEVARSKKIDLKRISSALLGFPLVVLILVVGNKYFVDLALSIIAILAMNEYLNAVSEKSKPIKWISYFSCAFVAVIHLIPKEYLYPIIVMILPIILLILFIQVIVTEMKTTFHDVVYTIFGIIYIPFFMSFIALTRGLENGKLLIWYLIGAAWITDICAYLVGKTFGKHKFNKISPKKTMEGSVGGILGTAICIILYTLLLNNIGLNYSYIYTLIMGIALSVISQIGDLTASAIKRYVGIKDFSNLIPGHGGMLDRIDSLLFIAPFAYILISML